MTQLIALLTFLWFSVSTAEEVATHHRIAFGSCFNPNRGDDIWNLIKEFSPNQLLLLGDQVYADFHPKTGLWQKSNPDILRKEYEKFFAFPGWKSLSSSLSHGWQATYDDHDYGVNNGDKTWKYREQALTLFEEFNRAHFTPVRPSNDNGSSLIDGVYSAKDFTISRPNGTPFIYTVILLDTRSNKDPLGTANGDFLGAQQWRWLEHTITKASQRSHLILLGSSIQVLPEGKATEESWSEFPAAKARLLKLVALAGSHTNIVLLSGDVHSAEFSQATCTITPSDSHKVPTSLSLLEFTSSGLSHTFTHRIDRQQSIQVAKAKKQQKTQDTKDAVFVNHLPKLIYSRGFVAEALYNVYQVAQPASHRKHRFGDLYANLHFGLIDFVFSPDGDDEKDVGHLVLRTINYEGRTVMYRRVPLSQKKNSASKVDEWSASTSTDSVVCVNYHGEPSLWRKILERMTLTLFVLVTVFVPLVVVVWFVGAAVFYLCWGKERARREQVEARYRLVQQANKAKLH